LPKVAVLVDAVVNVVVAVGVVRPVLHLMETKLERQAHLARETVEEMGTTVQEQKVLGVEEEQVKLDKTRSETTVEMVEMVSRRLLQGQQ
jgi:hypothetical protein